MNSGVLIYLITPFLSAVSQLILKKAADNPRYTGLRAYLNLPVIGAYALFFGCMLLNVAALRTLDLTVASVLEASGYIYVMALSFFFLFTFRCCLRSFCRCFQSVRCCFQIVFQI